MLEAFSASNRLRTLVYFALAALFAVAAAVVGIDDNPLGIALVVLSGASLVLAFTHPWKSSRRFRRLIYASIIGFAALLGLGIALQAAIEFTSAPRAIDGLMEVVSTAFLLAAGFLCIPAVVVGVVGALVMRRRERKQQQPEQQPECP